MTNSLKETFGSNLKVLREKKGLSKKDFAEKLGITPQSYGKFESGVGFPSFDTLDKIASVLDISADVNQLFRNEENEGIKEVKLNLANDILDINRMKFEIINKLRRSLLEERENISDEENERLDKEVNDTIEDIKNLIDVETNWIEVNKMFDLLCKITEVIFEFKLEKILENHSMSERGVFIQEFRKKSTE